MSFLRFSRAEMLPVERSEYGYLQRASYTQPDMHDELVVELDGPFSKLAPSGAGSSRGSGKC